MVLDLRLDAGIHIGCQLLCQSFQPLGGHLPMTAQQGSQLLCALIVYDSLDLFCIYVIFFLAYKGSE